MPLFKEIPVELRDVSIIQRWLAVEGNYFDQIPDELVTDELRKIAIKSNPEQINFIFFRTTHTSSYRQSIRKIKNTEKRHGALDDFARKRPHEPCRY